MKKLILISALLFSFNGWGEELNLLCDVMGNLAPVQKDYSGIVKIFIDIENNTGWIEPAGSNKEFKFRKITIDEKEIFFTYKRSPLDKCRSTIDRTDGEITHSCPLGSHIYSGTCNRYTPKSDKKF